MRVCLTDLFSAERRGGALPAFTCYTFEGTAGVVRAAERAGTPLCMLLAAQAFRAADGERLATTLVALAERAAVPTAVQLDHCGDLPLMRRALDLGVTGLMADGSALPFERNVALVGEAVALAGGYGASVEAELGRVTGEEDRSTGAAAGAMTDPDEAVEFVRATGVPLLAVAIGNVHGTYRTPPRLDWDRLSALARRVPAGLALHGASGLTDVDIAEAIRRGVVKVNVNTELRQAYYAELDAAAPATRDGWQLLALSGRLTEAVERAASERLRQYADTGGAP